MTVVTNGRTRVDVLPNSVCCLEPISGRLGGGKACQFLKSPQSRIDKAGSGDPRESRPEVV